MVIPAITMPVTCPTVNSSGSRSVECAWSANSAAAIDTNPNTECRNRENPTALGTYVQKGSDRESSEVVSCDAELSRSASRSTFLISQTWKSHIYRSPKHQL